MGDETESTYDKPRQMRVPKSEWLPFDEATKAIHPEGRGSRARVLREFMRWYMRRPGARPPERPSVGPWSDPDWLPPED
jgi:hypothetical protein